MARISYPHYKEIVTTSRIQVKRLKKTTFRCIHTDCQCTAYLPLWLFFFFFPFFSFLFLGAIDDLLDLQPEENGMKHLCMSVSSPFQLQAPIIILILDLNCFHNLKG